MAAERKFDAGWSTLVYRLLTSSPPAQLGDVCQACRQLVQAAIPDAVIAQSCRDHNEKEKLVVPLGASGGTGIVCEQGRRDRKVAKLVSYLDPRLDNLFVVDHESQECTEVKPRVKSDNLSAEFMAIDDSIAKPYKQALERRLDDYVAARFPRGGCGRGGVEGHSGSAVYIFMGDDVGGDVELQIVLASRRCRVRGQWAGTWTSQWRIVFDPEQHKPAQLGGIIDFSTHYTEDGNVHFRRRLVRKVMIAETDDPEKFAGEVVKAVGRFEDEFHVATDDLCLSFGADALKAMRRVLPLSKERFDWRPARQSLIRDMKSEGNNSKP